MRTPREEMNMTLSLHAVVRVSTSERISISSNCKGLQCIGRCRCIKNKVICLVHCHATKFYCGNLSNLQIQTEIAIVQRLPVTTTGLADDTESELSQLVERWLLQDGVEEEEVNGQLEMEATLNGKSLRSRRRKRADTTTSVPLGRLEGYNKNSR